MTTILSRRHTVETNPGRESHHSITATSTSSVSSKAAISIFLPILTSILFANLSWSALI